MLVRADLQKREVVTPEQYNYVASPLPGVSRMMLDRQGNEIARATSIVKYDAGAGFTAHTHGGGEEILVLDGVFSDEHGDYPAGTYIRNPPGTSHTPFSKDGCTILVKLWQFAAGDHEQLALNTNKMQWRPGLVPGLSVLPLHEHDGINTALVRWAPNTQFNPHMHPGGEEIYVIKGLFRDEHGEYPAGSWLRSPRWSKHTPFTGEEGALIYVKVGHLGANFLELPSAS
ncbi:cupin [Aliidiomarina iranensis]|uniref:Cupin n=1 Tax=Aliidiomarina iranensis TaxID=1434071 RepID=A0A432VZU4_9GAMM|nr:cupin domain-containing protein [Aliidiomarina iranensis]RUO22271.1 cupin [Aliidiomarina iranensis]